MRSTISRCTRSRADNGRAGRMPSVSRSSSNAAIHWRGLLVERVAVRDGVLDDPVVDVGEVHHVRDLREPAVEPAAQHVLEDERAEVADVDTIPDRRSAGVERGRGRARSVPPRRAHGSSCRAAAGSPAVPAAPSPTRRSPRCGRRSPCRPWWSRRRRSFRARVRAPATSRPTSTSRCGERRRLLGDRDHVGAGDRPALLASLSATTFRNSQPEVSFQCGSCEGKCWPMSPRPEAPRIASTRRVHHRVAVGVAEQAAAVRDQDAAEHQMPARDEPVRVDAVADSRGHRDLLEQRAEQDEVLRERDLEVARVAGHHRDRLADRLDERGIVAGVMPCAAACAVGAAQEIGAECLWRLRRDQRRAVEGGRDAAVAHLLHSVHAGYPGGRRSISPRRVEHRPEHVGGVSGRAASWTEIQSWPSQRSSAAATLSWRRSPPSRRTTGGSWCSAARSRIAGPARGRCGHHDEVEAARRGDRLERDREDRTPARVSPELVLPRPHATPEGGHDERAGQRCATLARTGRSTRGLIGSSAVERREDHPARGGLEHGGHGDGDGLIDVARARSPPPPWCRPRSSRRPGGAPCPP